MCLPDLNEQALEKSISLANEYFHKSLKWILFFFPFRLWPCRNYQVSSGNSADADLVLPNILANHLMRCKVRTHYKTQTVSFSIR